MAHDLTTWAERYLKSRDAFERQLVSLERIDAGLAVTFKKRSLTVLAQEKLDADSITKTKGDVLVLTLQTDANFAALVKEFPTLAAKNDLTMLFVNPDLNEKWSIKPAVHYAVADKESLKAGLTTMFQVVPTV